MRVGPLIMLILQPTPFCNIDCDYCYLPGRSNKARMTREVVNAAISQTLSSGLVQEKLDVLWHAGEPLVVGKAFYREAHAVIAAANSGQIEINQVLQTNGILIDQEWCELFREQGMRIGVSIDGPQDVHDRHRVSRSGEGTFSATMKGVERLSAARVPFSAMAVLTRESLRDLDRVLTFFEGLGAVSVAFNLEEDEPNGHCSSLANADVLQLYRDFIGKAYALHVSGKLNVREISHGMDRWRVKQTPIGIRAVPLEMVTVGHQGDFSTFCPELHGVEYVDGRRHIFGNVLRDSLFDIFANPDFIRVQAEIFDGVMQCAATCDHFGVCGSQRVGVKYFSQGTFAASETLFCRAHIKVTNDFMDVALGSLGETQNLATAR